MKYLYIDNFRGFKDTLIPLKDVNFLVGENSTGKTSILELLNLLSSNEFWFNQDFTSVETRFSNYKDIVSISSENKKYFKFGFINSDFNKEKSMRAFLLTFVEKEGLPIIQSYKFINKENQISIKYSEKKIHYKITLLKDYKNDSGFINKIFNVWIKNKDENEYKVLNIPFQLGENLVLLPSVIDDLLLKGNIVFGKKLNFPFFIDNIVWLGPIRSKPKKIYDDYKLEIDSEGKHVPFLIRKIFEKKPNKILIESIKRFGENSELFESISITNFGSNSTSPFELDIIINKNSINIYNTGYGISQTLPIFIESILRPKNSWFAIQQPEIHLHPKAQAALGNLFYELAIIENKKFLIETHSDYIIDRFRQNYNLKGKKPDAQILYFERNELGNNVYPLEIDEKGNIQEDQPQSYRDFFIKEQMKILGL